MTEYVKDVWCLFIAVWATLTDIKYHKIKNATVITGIIGGFALNTANIQSSIIAFAIPLILILLFAVNMMGAGDIKLLSAVGSIVCYPDIVTIVLFSFVFCGIHILVRAISKHQSKRIIKSIWQDIKFFFLLGLINKTYKDDEKIPMACSIAVAVFTVIIIKQLII